MHFVIVIYTACKSLANWWGLFLGTSHFDSEVWQNSPPPPPVGPFGGRIPPELQISFKKWNLCKYLMVSKYLYISGSVKTYTIFQK